MPFEYRSILPIVLSERASLKEKKKRKFSGILCCVMYEELLGTSRGKVEMGEIQSGQMAAVRQTWPQQ